MYNPELSISLTTLATIIFLATMIGYAFRSRKTRRKQLRIRELKREIIYSHAQILELQKEFVVLESEMKKMVQVPGLTFNSGMKEYPEISRWASEGLI